MMSEASMPSEVKASTTAETCLVVREVQREEDAVQHQPSSSWIPLSGWIPMMERSYSKGRTGAAS